MGRLFVVLMVVFNPIASLIIFLIMMGAIEALAGAVIAFVTAHLVPIVMVTSMVIGSIVHTRLEDDEEGN